MSLKDRVQVEGLDDERWSRIERSVVASVRAPGSRALARRSGWIWGAGAVAVAAAAVGLVVLSGKVLREAQEGTGTGTEEKLEIATENHGTRVELGGATAIAAAETSFTVTRPRGGLDIVLAHGRIDLDVPHRPDHAPLVVHAGDVDVIDVGTVFSVTRADAVTVEVREGEVQVARAGRVARVAAGQRWSEPLIASPTTTTATSTVTATNTNTVTATATVTVTATNTGPHALTLRDPLTRKHVATAPASPSAVAEASVHHARAIEGERSEPPDRDSNDVIMDLQRAIKDEPIAPGAPTDGADAFAAYQAMMLHGTGGTPSQGLYGMARARFAAGALADAMQWLDAYQKRFPRGDETEAVLWLRVRIRCQARFDDACRAAAQTYLDRYPSGHRSHLAELATNTR